MVRMNRSKFELNLNFKLRLPIIIVSNIELEHEILLEIIFKIIKKITLS